MLKAFLQAPLEAKLETSFMGVLPTSPSLTSTILSISTPPALVGLYSNYISSNPKLSLSPICRSELVTELLALNSLISGHSKKDLSFLGNSIGVVEELPKDGFIRIFHSKEEFWQVPFEPRDAIFVLRLCVGTFPFNTWDKSLWIMALGEGVVRSTAFVLRVRGAATCLLSPLSPKSKLTKSRGPGIKGLKGNKGFKLWATNLKGGNWVLSFLSWLPSCLFRVTRTHGLKASS